MLKILLLEDDDFFRKSFLRLFHRHHYEVIDLPNGEGAVEICEAEKPDIVITDILMPVVDGLSFIDSLRKTHNMTPVIAVSGGGKSIAPDLCLDIAGRYGATAVIEKPFDNKELINMIETMTQ